MIHAMYGNVHFHTIFTVILNNSLSANMFRLWRTISSTLFSLSSHKSVKTFTNSMSKTENHKYYLDECFHRFWLPKPLQQDSKIVHKSVKNLSTQYAWKVIAKICVLPSIMKLKCTPKSFQFWDLWSRFPDSGSQHGSKIDFEAPKSLPRAPKRPPRAAKRHLGALKKLPRRCQEAQLRPQNNSKTYFETLLEQNK